MHPAPTHLRQASSFGLKRLARELLLSRVFRPAGDLLCGRGSCLTYHRVLPGEPLEAQERSGFSPNIELAVSVEAFESQIKYLSQNYEIVSVPEAIPLLKAGTFPRRAVLITFDDGYQDNLTYALPILKRYRAPATIYLTTDLIGQQGVPWWFEMGRIFQGLSRIEVRWNDQVFVASLATAEEKNHAFCRLTVMHKHETLEGQRKLMEALRALPGVASVAPTAIDCSFLSWDEVAQLSREPLITLGSHTKTHATLLTLSDEALRDELVLSRSMIEQKIGKKVEHFAYPYGGTVDARRREFRMVQEAGYASGFTTRPGHLHSFMKSNLHSMPRIIVGYYDTLDNLHWKLSGFSAGFRQLGDLFRTYVHGEV